MICLYRFTSGVPAFNRRAGSKCATCWLTRIKPNIYIQLLFFIKVSLENWRVLQSELSKVHIKCSIVSYNLLRMGTSPCELPSVDKRDGTYVSMSITARCTAGGGEQGDIRWGQTSDVGGRDGQYSMIGLVLIDIMIQCSCFGINVCVSMVLKVV